MLNDQLKFVLETNGYTQNGTKEACVKAMDFLKNCIIQEDELYSQHSCVSADEFVNAVKTLVAYTFKKADEIPETYYCDNDCKKVADLLCPGKFNISKESVTKCPYFMDESYI